ncbi:hypothetical protein H0H81_011753 [Sphagnurus paluster]|uniref:Uncharacterized protein n=1 Tax=Sphagnurus paluster TaxID=117069 RepID=A0A9P7KJB1_9AGAR|nr:hypothetical protein H0H81_011753 [Sphagnurus paluster]
MSEECEVLAQEHSLRETEQRLLSLFNRKDEEIASLQQLNRRLQQSHSFPLEEVELAVKQAMATREEELQVLVIKREDEVATAIAKREQEIMEAVCAKKAEFDASCARKKKIVEQKLDAQLQWVLSRENELRLLDMRLKVEIAAHMKEMEMDLTLFKGGNAKAPLGEVKNLPELLQQATQAIPEQRQRSQHSALTIIPPRHRYPTRLLRRRHTVRDEGRHPNFHW